MNETTQRYLEALARKFEERRKAALEMGAETPEAACYWAGVAAGLDQASKDLAIVIEDLTPKKDSAQRWSMAGRRA